jgi:hypothetical protein
MFRKLRRGLCRSFTIVNNSIGGAGGNSGAGDGNQDKSIKLPSTGVLIPITGFNPNVVTNLPVQLEENAYDTKDNLHLEIPRLGFNQPIVGIQFKDKGWDVKWLDDDIGYLEGSAYLCWLLASSVSFFGFLGGNFVRQFSFSLQGGLGLFSEYALVQNQGRF